MGHEQKQQQNEGGSALLPAKVTATIVGCSGLVAIVLHWSDDPVYALTLLSCLPVWCALALRDVTRHVLPNRLTAASMILTVLGLVAGTSIQHINPTRMVWGALASGAWFFALVLLSRGTGMGLGDAKLAPSVGALAAWLGWNEWLLSLTATYALGAGWGIILLSRGRGLKERMPFGPMMLMGATFTAVISGLS